MRGGGGTQERISPNDDDEKSVPGKSVNMYEFEYEIRYKIFMLQILFGLFVVGRLGSTSRHQQHHVVFSIHILYICLCALFFHPKRFFLFVWKNYHKYICIYILHFFVRCVRVRVFVCIHFAWSFVCVIVSFFRCCFFSSECCLWFSVCCVFFHLVVPHGPPTAFMAHIYIHTNTLPSKMKINLISTVVLSYIHHSRILAHRSCFGFVCVCVFSVRRRLCKFLLTKHQTTFKDYTIIFRGRMEMQDPDSRFESRSDRDIAKNVHRLWMCNFNRTDSNAYDKNKTLAQSSNDKMIKVHAWDYFEGN